MSHSSGAIAAILIFSSFAKADYAMAPIEEVLRTVPIVVDATISRIDAKTGAVHLTPHRVFRGAVDAKSFVVSKTCLSCCFGAPSHFGAKLNHRYVFLLQATDTLFEGSTFYEVTGDANEPKSLRISQPIFAKRAAQPSITFEAFAALIAPAKTG